MKFCLGAMTNGYQLENIDDGHPLLGHICSLLWVLGGLNEKVCQKIGFDQQEYPVGSR